MEPDHVSPESDPVDDAVAASEAPDASAAAEDASSFEPVGAAVDPEADAEVETEAELVAEADVDDESDLTDELGADGSNSDGGAPGAFATAADDGIDGPSVDELEGRLGEVEQAMAQIQSGQLDEAEATLASLDHRIGSTSD